MSSSILIYNFWWWCVLVLVLFISGRVIKEFWWIIRLIIFPYRFFVICKGIPFIENIQKFLINNLLQISRLPHGAKPYEISNLPLFNFDPHSLHTIPYLLYSTISRILIILIFKFINKLTYLIFEYTLEGFDHCFLFVFCIVDLVFF